jgi:hypothetical protein
LSAFHSAPSGKPAGLQLAFARPLCEVVQEHMARWKSGYYTAIGLRKVIVWERTAIRDKSEEKPSTEAYRTLTDVQNSGGDLQVIDKVGVPDGI